MLSDRRIIAEMQYGNIMIDPFCSDNLGPNSYDCHLGKYFCEMDPNVKEIHLANEESVKKIWLPPREAIHTEFGLSIPVKPGETILAHTEEFIGGLRCIVPEMRCRSTFARVGLSVCKCAGVGDVGYYNRWTMEISNFTQALQYIPVGMKICQFIFNLVGTTKDDYKGYYSKANWQPENMLPNPRIGQVKPHPTYFAVI